MERLCLNGHCATTHLFKVEVDSCFEKVKASMDQVLAFTEREKANRFFYMQDKKRYLVSRFVLRHILSLFVAVSPEQICFFEFGNRKPAVQGVEFNLSHSGNLLLIAVSSLPVGIDVELVSPDLDFESIFSGNFSAGEQLRILQSKQPLNSFYAYWTRKEAVLKASAEGLIDNMDELDVNGYNVVRNGKSYMLKTYPLLEGNYMFSVAGESDISDLLLWDY
jgi:4'-phosphopantetheinyl transferase